MKLLLVEDEEDLAVMLARGLRGRGYTVEHAYDGEEACYLYGIGGYDLVILDLNLPKLDGIEVLRRIRACDPAARVLILSARSRIDERVLGLDAGANDYLVKPFDFLELDARVRTLLRADFVQRAPIVKCGRLSFDPAARTLTCDAAPVLLTRMEMAVFEYLINRQGIVVSSEELFEHIWDSEADPFSNTVKLHIHAIKKKLRAAGAEREYIVNLRGQGYMVTEDPL
ncbi:response regulator transcription factor [Murimonas intestini]|uniref:Stage 0 sporulation protein A homolog n=1 Tax=Murimonas intestini TaxID=1337051 RepID=A0AB73T9M6_9FIRM|nr:response regulator transcription factor [Murimonas intestini]MCR1839315.1 response regulator transcription factor [Murimonas intestini]MCR1864610.1 response regulator transcription factor [Murimonas intestini]MCR1882220.1 response regulator transcription factor [Murimonas intestini]